jgi:hypothetical protein
MTTEEYGAVALTKEQVEVIEGLVKAELARCQHEITDKVNANKFYQAREAEERGKLAQAILKRLTLFVPLK